MEALHHKSSPLDTFVRSNSTRRTKHAPPPLYDPPSSPVPAPPQQWDNPGRRPPSSPLLHTHFRGSTLTQATTADGASLYRYPDTIGRPVSNYPDDESIYSDSRSYSRAVDSYAAPRMPPTETTANPSLRNILDALNEEDMPYRQSWESSEASSRDTIRAGAARDTWTRYPDDDDDPSAYTDVEDPEPLTPVPTVVISSPSEVHSHPTWPAPSTPDNRTRSALPSGYNFSRPGRFVPPQTPPRHEDDMTAAERKQLVLERNKYRSNGSLRRQQQEQEMRPPEATMPRLPQGPSSSAPLSKADPDGYPTYIDPPTLSHPFRHNPPIPPPRNPLRESEYERVSPTHTPSGSSSRSHSSSPPPPDANVPGLLRSPSSSSSHHNDFPRTPPQHSPLTAGSIDPSSLLEPPSPKNGLGSGGGQSTSNSQFVQLPNRPYSPRPLSPATSIYSQYSYYQLGDRTPSPNGSNSGFPHEGEPEMTDAEHVAAAEKRAKRASKTIGGLLNGGLLALPPNAGQQGASPNFLQPPDAYGNVRPSASTSQATLAPAVPSGPTPAEEYLQQGIVHHEANRLVESAACFERAATLDGGCGAGMLMWGLTLRHAWGVKKDEKAGFKWLRRAAEAAVEDLEGARRAVLSVGSEKSGKARSVKSGREGSVRSMRVGKEGSVRGVRGGKLVKSRSREGGLTVPAFGDEEWGDMGSVITERENDETQTLHNVNRNAVQAELIMAIYEVGQCYFRGWGVGKDQKMGVSYFQVAAQLGDADAQQELAFCLANGRGCKKNRKEAAKWYRAAVAQGTSDVGLAWIYKDKYR